MENNIKYRLNKTENLNSVNVDGYVNIELKNKTKELIDDAILKRYDIIEQYEKNICNFIIGFSVFQCHL